MKRVVEDEILDSLDEDSPDAMATRKDIHLFNRLMGNYRWFASQLNGSVGEKDRIVEIGAGGGQLGAFLLKKEVFMDSTSYTGIDLWSRPQSWPVNWFWKQEDLLDAKRQNADILLGNLILHQFEDHEIRRIFEGYKESLRQIYLIETCRRKSHLFQVDLARVLSIDPISVHDAKVSIRAGFLRGELPEILGLNLSQWEIEERETFFGALQFKAIRK